MKNSLELVFENISTFDEENPIVGSLLTELDVGKRVLASDLLKQVPCPPAQDFAIRDRLNKLRDKQKPTNNNNNISPPPSSPALLPPDPGPFIPPPASFSTSTISFFNSFQTPPPPRSDNAFTIFICKFW